jgi:hypothetical protein
VTNTDREGPRLYLSICKGVTEEESARPKEKLTLFTTYVPGSGPIAWSNQEPYPDGDPDTVKNSPNLTCHTQGEPVSVTALCSRSTG